MHFNSRFFQLGCKAVNAFSRDWGNDNNWLCPPICLIVRVLRHMEPCTAKGTLVVRVWKSSFFWNACALNRVHWIIFVITYLPAQVSGIICPRKSLQFPLRFQTAWFWCCRSLFGLLLSQPPSRLVGFCTINFGKCAIFRFGFIGHFLKLWKLSYCLPFAIKRFIMLPLCLLFIPVYLVHIFCCFFSASNLFLSLPRRFFCYSFWDVDQEDLLDDSIRGLVDRVKTPLL